MSESDSFIDEVTEEVRRDRLFALFKKYGWIAVLAVVLIVGTAGWREWNKAQAERAARAFGDAVTATQAVTDPAARIKALEAIKGSGKATGDRAFVLDFLIASAAVEAKDNKTALTALERVAKDAKAPQTFRDLAALKRIIVAGDAMKPAERKTALEALAQAGRPYRPLALEQLALMKAKAGDKAAAIKAFKELLQEPGNTAGLRRRATEMIVALGGNPAAS
jgi:hypothetical protein